MTESNSSAITEYSVQHSTDPNAQSRVTILYLSIFIFGYDILLLRSYGGASIDISWILIKDSLNMFFGGFSFMMPSTKQQVQNE